MKRIQFIAPVEAIRGNMSGNQDLRYAEHDNKAFEAPEGVQYARNYTPRFIGARVSKSGLCYFQVKTKSATKVTMQTKRNMALIGAVAGIESFVKRSGVDKWVVLQQVYAQDKGAGLIGSGVTFKMWLDEQIRTMLTSFAVSINIGGQAPFFGVEIRNPWRSAAGSKDIAQDLLMKFWDFFVTVPITFLVGSVYGNAMEDDTFGDFVAAGYNTIGLSLAKVGNTDYVKQGDNWVKDEEGNYVTSASVIANNGQYGLSDQAPTA